MLYPYDYVRDHEGWTYVVRGCDSMGNVIAKAIYAPPDRRGGKCHSVLPPGSARPVVPGFRFADHTHFSLTEEDIACYYPRNSVPAKDALDAPLELILIMGIMTEYKAECYIFGSRRLGEHTSHSDWDLLVCSSASPEMLVQEILVRLGPKVRPFTHEELCRRANRYWRPDGYTSLVDLGQIFLRTCLYLRSDKFEIGLFFSPADQPEIPSSDILSCAMPIAVTGTPLPNNGRSFHMPREIVFVTDVGKILNIRTIAWELGGIEAMAGQRMEIDALQYDDTMLWFGSPYNRLRLIS